MLLILTAALATPLGAAPVPKNKKTPDAEKIVGRWRVVGREFNGGPRSGREECFWVFEADKMTIFNTKGDRGSVFTYRVEEAESPKRLDLNIGNGQYQGLYDLDGDNLKWANTGPGGKRPDSVTSGNNVNLIIFTRE